MALTKPKLSHNIDTDSSVFTDPILVLHQSATSANVDSGFLFNRANGLVSNVAIYWSESANTFVTAFTTNAGSTNSNISVSTYANLRTGILTSNSITNSGTLVIGNTGDVSANIGVLYNANIAINANLGAFQLYANANIGTLFLGNASTNANLGTLFLGNASTNAHLGAFQTYANSTVAAIQANLGAYQTYANANAATQATTIDTLLTQVYSNANVTAYLVTYSGNIAVGNIQITGNINYTPNTAGNYNQTITNMQLALDELAARVKALGG
jgi:hypothetical protein